MLSESIWPYGVCASSIARYNDDVTMCNVLCR